MSDVLFSGTPDADFEQRTADEPSAESDLNVALSERSDADSAARLFRR